MLHRKTTGKGPLLIFVHGNSQSLKVWDTVVANRALSGYTSIAVDLPGHGSSFRSDQADNDYSLQGLARNLGEFLAQYAGEPYILIGVSLGTNVIGELSPFPTNCVGAFLISPMIIGENMTPADIMLPNPALNGFFTEQPAVEQIDALLADSLANAADDTVASYKDMFTNTDPLLRVNLGLSIGQGLWADEIAAIDNAGIPVAMIFGTQDKFVNTNYLNAVELNKWQRKILIINHAGHNVQADQPDQLAELIAGFARDCFK